MNNQDILRQINRKKTPRWIYFLLIGMVVVILFVVIYIPFLNGGNNQDEKLLQIDTSLVGDGEEDPENVETNEEDGAEVIANELIIGTERVHAIDVSKWQGKIDWNAVKDSGIEAAFIRIGYRGENGTIYKDENADYNIQQAEKAGVLVGVYFFSTAATEEEVIEEANWTKAAIRGYSISYPVVYDCEGFENEDSRMHHLTKEERTNLALIYMKTIEEAGYEAMFYTSLNSAKDSADWDMTAIEESYKVWIANYPSVTYPDIETPDYTGKLHAWQYTNKGSVDGIRGNVDMVVCYFENEKADPKDKKARPEDAEAPKTEEEMQYTEVDEQVTAKDEVNLRESDSTHSNIVVVLKNGFSVKRIGIGKNGWSKLEYNGQTVYAITSYLTTDLTVTKPVEQEIVDGHIFTQTNDDVTAKEEVNLRTEPSTENSEIVYLLKNGEYVRRIGTYSNGWSKLEYNGQTVFAITSYLTK